MQASTWISIRWCEAERGAAHRCVGVSVLSALICHLA